MKLSHPTPAPGALQPAAESAHARSDRVIEIAAANRYGPLQAAIDRSPRMVAQRRAIRAAFGTAVQGLATGSREDEFVQKRTNGAGDESMAQDLGAPPVNETGMSSFLKAGIEALSGMDVSAVRVNRNSDKPAQMNAMAYAQGNQIYLGPGQEQHLPHEAWHVVQQAQGRVSPTVQRAGDVAVNDDVALETEADVMGARAMQFVAGRGQSGDSTTHSVIEKALQPGACESDPVQLYKANFGATVNESGTEVKTDVIAPNDTAGGTNVSAWPSWWPMGAAETANDFLRENFVQGHLLNQKLGGPGNTRQNLTPLTRSTNSQMSHSIENVAKTYLGQGLGIDYWLTADYSHHPSVSGVGASHLPQGEQQKLQSALNKMPGQVGAQITVHQHGAGGKWNALPKSQQPKDVYVKNEGAALKGSFV